MRPAFLASAFASSSRRWNMMVFSFYVLSESCYLSGIIVVKDELDDFRSNSGGEFCEFAEDVEHGNSSIFWLVYLSLEAILLMLTARMLATTVRSVLNMSVCGCLIVSLRGRLLFIE